MYLLIDVGEAVLQSDVADPQELPRLRHNVEVSRQAHHGPSDALHGSGPAVLLAGGRAR